jgi:hypothetical protein
MAKMLIQRGFGNIHDMASRGGPKVAQSERFLKRLMKTTLRRGQKVSQLVSIIPIAMRTNSFSSNRRQARKRVRLPYRPQRPTPSSKLRDVFQNKIYLKSTQFHRLLLRHFHQPTSRTCCPIRIQTMLMASIGRQTSRTSCLRGLEWTVVTCIPMVEQTLTAI